MKTIDEMTLVEKAWILLEKIEEVKNLLCECYYKEFCDLNKREKDSKITDGDKVLF